MNHYRRLLKLLHEIGAVGVLGGLAACYVLVLTAPETSAVGYAAVRQGIAAVARWLVVPSLAITLLSGLLAIVATRAYKDAGWAWIKALLGISMFEGTLLTIGGSTRKAAEFAAQVAAGQGDSIALAAAVRTERGGLVVLSALCVVNIVLAIWKPRIVRGLRDDD